MNHFSTTTRSPRKVIGAVGCADGTVLTADESGAVHVWEVDPDALATSLNVWKQMVGGVGELMSLVDGVLARVACGEQ